MRCLAQDLIHCLHLINCSSRWMREKSRGQAPGFWSGPLTENFCYCSVAKLCLTLVQPLGWQHARPPCPSPSPGVCPSPCPLNRWCHPTISSSVALFSFCLQFFPASGSFPMSHTFASEDQNTGASAQHQSLQWVFRVDLPWLVWSPCCPRDFQEPSPAPRFEGIDSLVLCLL